MNKHLERGMLAERAHVRRKVFGAGAEAADLLSRPDVFAAGMAACLGSMLLVPGAWLVAAPIGLVYGIWVSTVKSRLPFRLPLSWEGPDYSNPVPGGGNECKTGEGLLYLGNDAATNEELWLGNSDARRHAFVLGTTGAGKCLPADTLVLTPKGWVRNGDLRPGDQVIRPSGERANITSVHPQGRLPAVRMHFADGRFADCSHDHLWSVRTRARNGGEVSGCDSRMTTRTAADIGIFIHLNSLQNEVQPACRMYIPLPAPMPGPIDGSELTKRRADCAAKQGLGSLGFMPSLAGTPEERLKWFGEFVDHRRTFSAVGKGKGGDSVEIPALGGEDAFMLQHIVWSLGGRAAAIEGARGNFVRASFPGQEKAVPGASECDPSLLSDGLEIVDVDPCAPGKADGPSAGGSFARASYPGQEKAVPSASECDPSLLSDGLEIVDVDPCAPEEADGPIDGSELTGHRAAVAAKRGLGSLGFMPSLAGTPEERLKWFGEFIDHRRTFSVVGKGKGGDSVEIPALGGEDAFMLKQIVWSLGGRAAAINGARGNFVRASFPGQEKAVPGASECDPSLLSDGLEIVNVDPCAPGKVDDPSMGGSFALASFPGHEKVIPGASECAPSLLSDGLKIVDVDPCAPGKADGPSMGGSFVRASFPGQGKAVPGASECNPPVLSDGLEIVDVDPCQPREADGASTGVSFMRASFPGHEKAVPGASECDPPQLSDGLEIVNVDACAPGEADGAGAGGGFARASFPGQEKAVPGISECDPPQLSDGLEIVDVDPCVPGEADGPSIGGSKRPEAASVEMSCIRIDSDDGLFVAENYIVTHNTEFLLGLVSQSMIWSSGFLFIDGKGTSEFHGKAWSLVSRFGRQDDYRILNFTDSGGDPDTPAGGPAVQSNTLNPFSHGSPDQLMNLIASLMSDAGAGNDMWKNRAMSLVASTMKTLCEMRDAGDILLDVQSIRDHLPLGTGVKKKMLDGRVAAGIEDVPEAAWEELRTRGGMIELYLRARNGEFSDSSKLALKGFFESLPGFSLGKALNGETQEGKTAEQYGFLAMQLTKPLGSLADDFGHIFRTPFGEVDMEDVVLNRRILIVLLPALQKAPEEMRNCGKIVVAVLKMMMGKAAGSDIEGSKRAIIDARPTRSPSPFIVVLDEAGYYMVKGIDTMMAQARSLGFMIVIAGQDMAAMQSVSPQIAETASANARLTAAGAMEDAQKTWEFLRRKFGRHKVAVSTGRTARPGLFGMRWEDRGTASFAEEDRVSISDMQRLKEGEFYFLMESMLVKARAFHLGDRWADRISANKFIPVRGPRDRAPGLDQSKDAEFMSAYEAIGSRLLNLQELEDQASAYPFAPDDTLSDIIRDAGERMEELGPNERNSAEFRDAFQLAMLLAAETEIDEPDPEPEPDEFGWC